MHVLFYEKNHMDFLANPMFSAFSKISLSIIILGIIRQGIYLKAFLPNTCILSED